MKRNKEENLTKSICYDNKRKKKGGTIKLFFNFLTEDHW